MPISPPTATFPDAKNKVIRLSDVYWNLSRSLIQIRDALFEAYQSSERGGFWREPPSLLAYPWTPEDILWFATNILEADFQNRDQLGGWTGHIYTASAPFRIDFQPQGGAGFVRHEYALLDGLRNNLYAAALGQNKSRRTGRWKASTGRLTDKRQLRVPFR